MRKPTTEALELMENYALAEANDRIREKWETGKAKIGLGGGMCLYDNEIAEVLQVAKQRAMEML